VTGKGRFTYDAPGGEEGATRSVVGIEVEGKEGRSGSLRGKQWEGGDEDRYSDRRREDGNSFCRGWYGKVMHSLSGRSATSQAYNRGERTNVVAKGEGSSASQER